MPYTPTPEILKDPPRTNTPGAEKYDGGRIAEILSDLGLWCVLVDTIPAARFTTYHFDLDDPMDITRLTGPVQALESILHLHVSVIVPSPIASFALRIPRTSPMMVYLKPLLRSCRFIEDQRKMRLCAMLGTDASCAALTIDIAKMPHILVAGSTGSGKSVCVNSIIASLLFTYFPNQLQLVLIDPKKVEFAIYDGLPHLAVPVRKDARSAIETLKGLCTFMDQRYKLMAQKHVRNAADCGFAPVVVVIDELADLMLTSRSEAETSIVRLAQLGRAAGVHLIVATQRPTANIITGLIKSNIPCRIALQTASFHDSMTILDHKGAEQLTGRGDALLKLPDRVEEIRFQSAYTSEDDIERIVRYWQGQMGVK